MLTERKVCTKIKVWNEIFVKRLRKYLCIFGGRFQYKPFKKNLFNFKHAPIAIGKIYFLLNKSAVIEDNRSDTNTDYDYSTDNDTPITFRNNCTAENRTAVICRFSATYKTSQLDESVLVDQLVARITNNIYYHNFISNFFMYSLNGANFKKINRVLCFMWNVKKIRL